MRLAAIDQLIQQRKLHPPHIAKAGRLWQSGHTAYSVSLYLNAAADADLTPDQVRFYLCKKYQRPRAGVIMGKYESVVRLNPEAEVAIAEMARRGWPIAIIAHTVGKRWPALRVSRDGMRKYLLRREIPHVRRTPGGFWRYPDGDNYMSQWRPAERKSEKRRRMK